jgi:hypothetical protein
MGHNEAIAPTRYQVDAIRDLGNRVGALVEGYSVDGSFLAAQVVDHFPPY